jgi:hypothetical protein
MSHACIFCTEHFGKLDDLVVHLVERHRARQVEVCARPRTFSEFKVYYHSGHQRIRCFCGQRLTCNAQTVAPLFVQWAATNHVELDSFSAHLRRAGGLARHLQAVKDQLLLERIEKSCDPKVSLDCGG